MPLLSPALSSLWLCTSYGWPFKLCAFRVNTRESMSACPTGLVCSRWPLTAVQTPPPHPVRGPTKYDQSSLSLERNSFSVYVSSWVQITTTHHHPRTINDTSCTQSTREEETWWQAEQSPIPFDPGDEEDDDDIMKGTNAGESVNSDSSLPFINKIL